MAGIPQRLRTVVQQVEVFCHKTKQFHHDTLCCRDKIPKVSCSYYMKGLSFTISRFLNLSPECKFLTEFLNSSFVLFTVGNILCFKQVHRHLHDNTKNEHSYIRSFLYMTLQTAGKRLIYFTFMTFHLSVLYECIYRLFNDAVSNSDYRALNLRMIQEI